MKTPNIPGYEIIDRIADGGMATVWKAKQLSLDRLVALKVLDADRIRAGADVSRFQAEAKAAASLRHSGLCEIFDAGETDGLVYYVMEYVAGFSVHQLLARKGDLPEKQALMIARGVAEILQRMWEQHRVIHCDIKPANVLIDHEGSIRVTDLGLARAIGRVTADVDKGYLVGTPNYMSPEQASGVDDLDFNTDVYALGATLYHMLTGLMPFAQADDEKAAQGHIDDFIADPQILNAMVSNGAAFLVEKMMRKAREERYASWAEVIRDIEEVQSGRLPRGDLGPAGSSTVKRSEKRESSTRAEQDKMRPAQIARSATPPGPKKPALRKATPASAGAVRVKGDGLKLASSPSRSASGSPREGWSGPAGKTAVLLLITVGAYIGVFRFIDPRPYSPSTEPAAIAEDASAPAPTVEVVEPVVAPPRPEPVAPIEEPGAAVATAPEEPTVVAAAPELAQPTEAWDHPDFVRAMRLLREADELFQQFLEHRDQDILIEVEPMCRRAISLFESVRADAPAQARVAERIRQSYQLISNSRQARLMGN